MRQDNDLCFSLKYENVAWYEDGIFKLLNRRIYPVKTEFIRCASHREVAKAISARFCEGHTAIAAATCAMALAAYELRDLEDKDKKKAGIEKAAEVLSKSRPALSEAIGNYMNDVLTIAFEAIDEDKELDKVLQEYYVEIMNKIYASYASIAENMAEQCPEEGNIILHAPNEIYAAMLVRELKKLNKNIHFFIPEQRPTCCGSRLLAPAVLEGGAKVTVVSDGSIAYLMKNKEIAAYFNCSDQILSDSNAIAPIGGMQYALAAKQYNIPQYLVGFPEKGELKDSLMTDEEYRPAEALSVLGRQITVKGVSGYAPSYDTLNTEIFELVISDKGSYKPEQLEKYFEGHDDSEKADESFENTVEGIEQESAEEKSDSVSENQETVDSPENAEETSEKSDQEDFEFDMPDFSTESLGKIEFNQISNDSIAKSPGTLGMLDETSATMELKLDDTSNDKNLDDHNSENSVNHENTAANQSGPEEKADATKFEQGETASQSDEEAADMQGFMNISSEMFDDALPSFITDDMNKGDEPGSEVDEDFFKQLEAEELSRMSGESLPDFVSSAQSFESQDQNKQEKEPVAEVIDKGEPLMIFSDGTKIYSWDDLDPGVQEQLKKLNTPLQNLDTKMVEKMQKEAWKNIANSAITSATGEAPKAKQPQVKVNLSQLGNDYVPSVDEFAKAKEELEKMATAVISSPSSKPDIPQKYVRKVDQEREALVIDSTPKKKRRDIVADLGLTSPSRDNSAKAAHVPPQPMSSAWQKPAEEDNDKRDNKRGIFGGLFSRKNDDEVSETSFSDIDVNQPYSGNNAPAQEEDISIDEAMDDDIPAWQISMLNRGADD